MNDRLTFRIVTTVSDFFDLEADWRRLYDSSYNNNIFLSWDWISSWWQHFGFNKEPLVVLVANNGNLVGIAPFYRHRLKIMGVPINTVCLMGDGEVCSENLDILSSSGIEKEVCCSVFSFLINTINDWDLLLLDDIASDSYLLLAGRSYANDHGLRSKSYRTTTNPFFKITQPWDDYFQALGKKTKKNFRWGMNQLGKLGETRFIRFLNNCHMPLEQALSEMMRLHEACWNDRGRPGVFQRKPFRQFHKMISKKFFETRRLALFFFYCGDIPIAAEYGFIYRNKFYSYQAGYDPAYKKFGIGNIMQILTLEYFFKKGYQEFDFLRGELAYKDKYADQIRHNARLFMSRGTLTGDAAFIYLMQTRALKKKIKSLVPQTIWSKLRFYKENKSMRG